MPCYCVEEVDLNIFRGVFIEQWLNGKRHDCCQEALFYCTTCGPPAVQESMRATHEGKGHSHHYHTSSDSRSPEKKGKEKSKFGTAIKKFFSPSKTASKVDLTSLNNSAKSASSSLPGVAREHSTRLMSAEEEELPTTPRTEKEVYLCVTCGCCYCRDHACDHHYSRRYGPGVGGGGDFSAPHRGYPNHSFFIGVPSFVSTHPSHVLDETSWGLLFPTVTVPEIENGTVDLSKPIPFYENFEEICDTNAACGGAMGNSVFNSSFNASSHSLGRSKASPSSSVGFGHTRGISAIGSSGFLDGHSTSATPLLHPKTNSYAGLKEEQPKRTLLNPASVLSEGAGGAGGTVNGGSGVLSPPLFYSNPPENWSYLMFCAKCSDRQSVRLQGKQCDNDISRVCHLRRLGQLTALLAYFLLRGVRLEVPPEYEVYQAKKLAQQVERQHQQQRQQTAAAGHWVGKSTELAGLEMSAGMATASTMESSPTLANATMTAGFGMLSRTETDQVITRASVCGFANKSYLCYMNSVVQCLLRCRQFALPLLRLDPPDAPGKLTTSLMRLILHVARETYQDVRNGAVYAYVRALHAQLCNVNSLFSEDEQQDAQEFLITLLNGIADEFDKGKTAEQKSQSQRISFEGSLQTEVCCSHCNHRVPRNEMFMSLSIPIEKSIEEGVASLFTPTTLTGKDRYACEECFKKLSTKEREEHNALAAQQAAAEKKARAEGRKLSAEEKSSRVYASSVYREAEVRTSFSHLGGSLAVHLLRFHFDPGTQDFIKVLTPVRISLTLDLTPYASRDVVDTYKHIDKVQRLLRRFPTVSAAVAEKYFAAARCDVKAAAQEMIRDGMQLSDAYAKEHCNGSSGGAQKRVIISPNLKGDGPLSDDFDGSTADLVSISSSASTAITTPVGNSKMIEAAKEKLSSSTGSNKGKQTQMERAAAICAITKEAFDPFGERVPPRPSLVRHLVGIVAHRGSLHGGHYIAYVRHATRPHVWFRCDDEDVDVVEENYVLDHEAEVYLAFYE